MDRDCAASTLGAAHPAIRDRLLINDQVAGRSLPGIIHPARRSAGFRVAASIAFLCGPRLPVVGSNSTFWAATWCAARATKWNPERSVLYRAVASAWVTVRLRLELRERPLPRFCQREVDAYLRCGVLAHGFARVWCEGCRKDEAVAFSCKGRGFCPSCGARRMVDTAAWLVDRVFPGEAPVRQWVLSLPHRLRVLCAYDAEACALVRRVLVGAVSAHYEGRARRKGLSRPRTGAVAFVQRFDSGLRVNVPIRRRLCTWCGWTECTPGSPAAGRSRGTSTKG